VERFNLAQQPAAFAEDDAVRAALHAQGEASLPFITVNGEVRSSGVYPSRSDLAMWAGLGKPMSKLRIKITPTGPVCCTPSDAATNADPSAPPAAKCC
jgi:arsenite-transporting ATPase